MSHLLTKIVAAMSVALMLTGCSSKESKAGAAFADVELKVGQFDKGVIERYREAAGAYSGEQRTEFDKGVVDEIDEDATDSLSAMLRVLALPAKDLGRVVAENYSEKVIEGKTTPQDLEKYVDLLGYMAKMAGQADYGDELTKSMQEYIDAMPLDKQMQVYAHSSTPTTMGFALKASLMQPNADSALVEKQVEALQKIYTDEEYKEFSQIFNK